jgi:hypothetical protein
LAVAAVAGAAIPDSDDGEIHGCYQKNQGQLRVIDAQAGQACRPSEEPLVWNQEGVQGETGPRGPSDAFSRWHDTEVAATDLAAPRLLELNVPDGLRDDCDRDRAECGCRTRPDHVSDDAPERGLRPRASNPGARRAGR